MHHVNAVLPLQRGGRGYGLVELMISISLAAMIFTGAWDILANQQFYNTRTEQYYLVQHEAKNLLTVMQRELNRAGFNADADVVNPFFYVDPRDNSPVIFRLNSNQDCITYRYDRNADGIFHQEDFGFRLHHAGLQLRKGSNVNCDGGLGWETISQAENIEITQLRFSVMSKTVSPVIVKGIITITLRIRHRQFTDMALDFSRNGSVRVLL
ncbi:hypothetical protein [Moritella marina]|uniref:hypothetical protein n=1 Tax=Moritella marina TaxID=90736 RepID=UPI003703B342